MTDAQREQLEREWMAQTEYLDYRNWLQAQVLILRKEKQAAYDAGARDACREDSEDGKCHICGEMTESLAGNPRKWPMKLHFGGGNGKKRLYHYGCVIDAVTAAIRAREQESRT